jgi:hypothetical protein
LLHDLVSRRNFSFPAKKELPFCNEASLSPVGQTFTNFSHIKSKKMAKKSSYRVRDAKNGRFVKKGTEVRRPATTVKETIKKK